MSLKKSIVPHLCTNPFSHVPLEPTDSWKFWAVAPSLNKVLPNYPQTRQTTNKKANSACPNNRQKKWRIWSRGKLATFESMALFFLSEKSRTVSLTPFLVEKWLKKKRCQAKTQKQKKRNHQAAMKFPWNILPWQGCLDKKELQWKCIFQPQNFRSAILVLGRVSFWCVHAYWNNMLGVEDGSEIREIVGGKKTLTLQGSIIHSFWDGFP